MQPSYVRPAASVSPLVKCQGTTKAGNPCKRQAKVGQFCAQHAEDEPLTVAAAVQADLDEIGQRDPALARSGLAASALSLAREMDDKNSATSKSMCARALREALDRLRELAPAERKKDKVDELSTRRKARLARSAAAKG